jgi:hypothetical protein
MAKITSTPHISKNVETYLTLIIFLFNFLEANVSPATERRYTINPDINGAATFIQG